ncbi:MAG: FMN-binding protein, partial [Acidimicrobiales bacterium]
IQIRITMSGGRITQITTPQESATDGRSQSINSQAVPILTREALAAQNLNFDVVSGATYTSDAFAQALQSALGRAGK